MNPLSLVRKISSLLRARIAFRGKDIGSRVRVWGKLHVYRKGRMTIGDRTRFVATVLPTEVGVAPNGHLEIGANVFVNYGCSIAVADHIKIGDDTMIGTHTLVMDTNFHRTEPDRRLERDPAEPVIIGRNVWLANRVIVSKGVTIGDDSIVAAGSVVLAGTEIPAGQIWGGVPAKYLRDL